MSSVRLSKATKELNISLDRAVEELAKHGHEIPNNRNHKITNDQYEVLMTAFADDLARKKRSEEVSQQVKEEKEILRGTKDTVEAPIEEAASAPVEDAPAVEAPKEVAPEKPEPVAEEVQETSESAEPAIEVEAKNEASAEASPEDNGGLKVMGKIDLDAQKPKKKEAPAKPKKVAPTKKSSGGGAHNAPKPVEQAPAKEEAPQTPEDQEIRTKYVKIDGPKFTGQKIVLPVEKPKENKKKRTRIKKQGPGGATPAQNDPKNRNNNRGPQKRGPAGGRGRKQPVVAKQELTDEQIQKQIKETLEKLTSGKKNKGAKIRRDKRAERREREELADIQSSSRNYSRLFHWPRSPTAPRRDRQVL